MNGTAQDRLARVEALHHRRPHTSNGGVNRHQFSDFVAHGQTEFPDLCDHCHVAWPCETARAFGAERVSILDESTVKEPVAQHEADQPERLSWARCLNVPLGRCNDGRMQPWTGTDGHGGRETFYTCDRCGRQR